MFEDARIERRERAEIAVYPGKAIERGGRDAACVD